MVELRRIMPFDLENGPLLRSALLRTGDNDYVWGVAVHHLIADGRTLGIVTQEISGLLAGCAPPLPDLGYPDFVHWEHTRAGSAAVAANLDYWTDQLAGAPELDLPLDRPRPAVREHAGGRVDIAVPPALTARLTSLAAQESTTIFCVLLAVRLAQLHHYTAATDITIGVPVSGRLDTAFEQTAGCFVSTVIPRVDLSGDPDFAELIRRVTEVCTNAWDHQDYPYEEVVSRLAVDRDPSKNALFQTFFAYQNVFEDLTVPGADASRVPFATGTVQFDLELHTEATADGGLAGTFLYDRALFDEATIRTMGERWLVLAEQLASAPHIPLSQTSMATRADQALRTEVNQTDARFDIEIRADQLIARQAERNPGATALVFRGAHLTYGELCTAADGLAQRIVQTAGSGARVGILLNRSPDMVIAVLAAMKAGAVFVPLSPDLPPERLAYMAGVTSMQFALTSPDLAPRLPDGVQPLDVTGPPALSPAAAGAGPGTAAYVLFTSGSTGQPKGVEVSHRSLANLLPAMAKEPGLAAGDVLVAVTGIFFDIALLELLGPLTVGARVVIAASEETADPALLRALLEASAASVMQATPSTWQMLVDAGWAGQPGLRAWTGGEALSRDLADQLSARCAEVWNLYGPTETTIWSARSKVETTGPIKIGKPIENTRFYVLDGNQRLAPPGVPGELHIAGDGVALGYLGRPDETEQRFPVLDTLTGGPERVYRTGDLVRQLADGSLVYLGRTDLQLKVRGHRVEPEEIEHALRRHPAVQDAVLTLGPTGTLIGHVIAQEPVEAADLEAFTARLLPAHMVPRSFAFYN
ncbi:amino acid adenylation domain-containing protein [Streptomyces sp. NPDC004787]|uniref:non-ribosomal peptide synthetase n=1 Tax=Streptomyces sp. NPDC004787 TaxID=3154291 RepID=UPI0033B88FFA